MGGSTDDRAPEGPTRSGIEQQPALDGVRALAVVAVMLFHAGYGWMSGGYLGVSVFFTLSGYLITSLLLAEHRATGTVDIARFYTRRAKRLLPASLFWLAVVSVLAAFDVFSGVPSLRRDVLGGVFQVFNWVKLGSGESYADLNAAAAGLRHPLDHFWSLSVEQQFYWVWPVAFLGLVAIARRRRAALAWPVGVVAAIFCAGAPLIAAAWGPDAAYWATPARLAEILVGALLACLLAGREVASRWWVLAPLALVGLAVACVLFPDGSGPAYEGWLPLVAVGSAVAIVGLQPEAWPRRVLSARPLVAIGRVSYGIYIVHWPVYVVIDRQAWGLAPWLDLAVKWAVTGVLSALSYRLVEVPLRTSRWLLPRRTLVAGVAATAVAAALVVVVPEVHTYYGIDPDAASAAGIDTAESLAPLVTGTPAPTTTAAGTPTTTAPVDVSTTTTELTVPRPVRVLVVGDSTAVAIGAGLVNWAAEHPDLAQVSVVPGPGCGLMPIGILEVFGVTKDLGRLCAPYVRDEIPAQIEALRPDVVAVIVTSWDVDNRRLTPDGPLLSPLDPQIEQAMLEAYVGFSDDVLALGVPRIAWMVPPMPFRMTATPEEAADFAQRYVVQRRAIDAAATAHHEVRVIDLRTWMEARGFLENGADRPDGVHFTGEVATMTAEEFLGPAIVRAAIS